MIECGLLNKKEKCVLHLSADEGLLTEHIHRYPDVEPTPAVMFLVDNTKTAVLTSADGVSGVTFEPGTFTSSTVVVGIKLVTLDKTTTPLPSDSAPGGDVLLLDVSGETPLKQVACTINVAAAAVDEILSSRGINNRR